MRPARACDGNVWIQTVDKTDMFEWKPEYSIHVQGVDAQHKELFRLAESLRVAMMAGQGAVAVGKTLDRLADYTSVHFAYEERIMQQCCYPDYEAHKAIHDDLIRQVFELQGQYRRGQTITVQVLHFLKNWLVDHIANQDARLGPYVAKNRTA